jgi:hypothetical protein
MKLLIAWMSITLLFAACANGPQKASTNGPANANSTTAPTATAQDSKPADAGSASDKAAPVEFTYVGITPDKENFAYKVKVNTARPISQVDIAARYYDDKGKVIGDTTIAWQNVVKSTRQPIEEGKTYDATGYLEPGSTKVEAGLKRVVFKDGSSWSKP